MLVMQHHKDDMEYRSIDMHQLQRLLEKDNKAEPLSTWEPVLVLPDTDDVTTDGKLWKNFLNQVGNLEERVQRQRVNRWTQCMDTIDKQIHTKINTNDKIITNYHTTIEDKYKQIHNIFQQIKRQKIFKASQTKSSTAPPIRLRRMTTMRINIPQNNQKIIQLKNNIDNIRLQINNLQTQQNLIIRQNNKIKKQWQTFLINLLQNGYYRHNGVDWILQHLAKDYYPLTFADLPTFLDDVSKKCLLKHYHSYVDSSRRQIDDNILPTRSYSKSSIVDIVKSDRLKAIYSDTKQYIHSFVKQQKWKQGIALPKIVKLNEKTLSDSSQWKQHEKRRIVYAYNNQAVRDKVEYMFFGRRVT